MSLWGHNGTVFSGDDVTQPTATNNVARVTGAAFGGDFEISWTWTTASYGIFGVYETAYDDQWTGSSYHGGILNNGSATRWTVNPGNGGNANVRTQSGTVGSIGDPAGQDMKLVREGGVVSVYRGGVLAHTFAQTSENEVRIAYGGHDGWANGITDLSWTDQASGGESAGVTLSGGAGADTLLGGAGDDVLDGGAGSDTYLFDRGHATDTLDNNGSDTSSTDTLRFATGISAEQLWLTQSGDDLNINIVGSSDNVILSDWFTDTTKRVDRIETVDGSGVIETSEVRALVDAMAAFAPPTGSDPNLAQTVLDSLQDDLAAAWDS